jgi:hypothetical protein
MIEHLVPVYTLIRSLLAEPLNGLFWSFPTNFLELHTGEVPRIPLLGNSVNWKRRGKEEGKSLD